MKKYVIIHGHFYQPPRENPWIDTIETQGSAAPYHDWNERVYDECYRPNAYSRLLDARGTILDIHNNYRAMSFNFGPTLFSWLEQRHIMTARRIIEADADSCRRFDGHGNAMAQVFNHIIMPLASRRDQLTQIRWAKHYFRERFKREPEGMWLAETAINMETVCCLVEEKIRFVVLAPSQAEAFRPIEENAPWTPAGNNLDTRQSYRIYPADPAGNRREGFLEVFFYDAALSHDAGFGELLKDARVLGERIDAAYDRHSSADQAVILATDGETFGHHKPFGDMCIAYFFRKIAPALDIIPVNFGYFLSLYPPRHEVRLRDAFGEGTSWSCAHGVSRWVRDCGCRTGGEPSWRQQWRTPLRAALRELQEAVDREFESALAAERLLPWEVRDDYLRVFDDPSPAAFMTFLERHAGGAKFTKDKAMAVRRLLEAQKFMLYSFTSCGWFFADITGLEARQNIAYALRALQLGVPHGEYGRLFAGFAAALEQARSNTAGVTGRSVLERNIARSGAHEKILAFTAAVERAVGFVHADRARLFRYDITLRQLCMKRRGRFSWHGYDIAVANDLTGEQSRWAVLVSHREMAEVRGWVAPAQAFGKRWPVGLKPEAWTGRSDVTAFTLDDIFQTSRENMAERIHRNSFKDTYAKYSAWMQKNEKELDFLSRLDFPLPFYCRAPLSFVYNQQWNGLLRRLEHRGGEAEIAEKLGGLSRTLEQFKIKIDLKEGAAFLERAVITELSVLSSTLSVKTCARIESLLAIVDRFRIPVSKSKMEDAFAPIVNGPVRELGREVARMSAAQGEGADQGRARAEKHELLSALVSLAKRMNFNTDDLAAK